MKEQENEVDRGDIECCVESEHHSAVPLAVPVIHLLWSIYMNYYMSETSKKGALGMPNPNTKSHVNFQTNYSDSRKKYRTLN